MTYLIGEKLGMTRVFDEMGKMIPVTAVLVRENVIADLKREDRDGYNAVVVGAIADPHANKPQSGQSKSLTFVPKFKREFRTDLIEELKVGQAIDLADLEKGTVLKLVGTSKGKGFAGVIKRHNFRRGPETHGSDHHRHTGSIGSMFPQHVTKGHRMPGRMGNDQCTVRKVKVVDVLIKEQIVLVKGPVPGSRGALVQMSSN